MPASNTPGKSAKPLKVTAALVSYLTDGGEVRYAYQGAVLGDDASKESVEHLRSLGFVSDGSDDKNDK